ncbi:hypothetical protein [Parafrankia soli]|uniref:hypothetical protein n=1 Tax=Parafrankia soli TaxID=2599596 RepID=UPI0030844172
MGESRRRILSREILPNLSPPLGAYRPIVMAAPIVAEGPFSSLGMGIPPLQPSWGGMISDGKDAITDALHMVFVPPPVISFTVFALNETGDHATSSATLCTTDHPPVVGRHLSQPSPVPGPCAALPIPNTDERSPDDS